MQLAPLALLCPSFCFLPSFLNKSLPVSLHTSKFLRAALYTHAKCKVVFIIKLSSKPNFVPINLRQPLNARKFVGREVKFVDVGSFRVGEEQSL